MDLRRLRYFVAVAEERHFGRAAERLYIAQPALSQQIRALETELGAQLFARSTRRVDLTPAGARLLPRVLALLADADAAFAEAKRVHEGTEGVIRLGFIGSATYGLMPSLSRALSAELPSLRVELKGEMLSPEVEQGLATGALDLGVLRPFATHSDIEHVLLRTEPLVAALPEGHRLAHADEVTLADLAGDPWITYPRRGSAMGDAMALATAEAGFSPEVRTEVRETATLVSFVAAGLGVSVVPQGVRSVLIPGVVYVPLAGEAPTVQLVAAWRSKDTDGPEGVVRQTLQRLQALTARD